MPVSMKEIAERVGVSITTVARALKNKPDISAETREKVIAAAEKLNYRPNVLARGLVTNRTYAIGLIVTDLMNPFFPELIKGIEDEANESNYSVILASSSYDPDKEEEAIHVFRERRVDGLVISPTESQQLSSAYELLRQENIPFVLTKAFSSIESDIVMANDQKGAYMATRHMVSVGCSRIAYIGSDQAFSANSERLAGYKAALTDAGIPLREDLILACDHRSPSQIRETVDALVGRGDPDGVLAFCDLTAFVVSKALRDQDLRIPEDVVLVGFDDIVLSRYLEPALTTVALPKYEIGRQSVKLLLKRLKQRHCDDSGSPRNNTSGYERIILDPELKIRESSKR